MSMMMRRGAPGQMQRQELGGHDLAADPRFPEVAGSGAVAVSVIELRARLETLGGQRFNGYLTLGQATRVGGTPGVLLLHEGFPIHARFGATDGQSALTQALTPNGPTDTMLATHALTKEATLALAATFLAPQHTQPMGSDSGEVALLLRDLTGVRHSGVVQIHAFSARSGGPVWARILMYDGKILGVYSGADRHLKASLADLGAVLAESTPQLILYSIQEVPAALALPLEAVSAPSAEAFPAPGATPTRDEVLETDLVWFMSRFERAFGRLKERREPQADLLRAFGELNNELASFVAAMPTGNATPAAAQGVVAAELTRARATGAVTTDFKLGKAGLDAAALAKGYGALTKRSPAAAAYFAAASADVLTLIGRLMERMLGAFYDPVSAGFAREGCETLLREVRGGLAEMTRR
ncbi:MAG TPA: hypothetical protein VIL85_30000 [Thermomicrobiales bacterium]|jgi:hypothetical protein